MHQRIAATRNDWHFKLAHHLWDNAGLGQFTKQIISWMCWKQDVYYIKVDARGT